MKTKKIAVLMLLVCTFFVVIAIDKGFGHSNSAPVMDCTSCHQGEFKADKVKITGLPTVYKPGSKYKLTVLIQSDLEAMGESRGGFALEVTDGKILVTDKRLTQYIERYLTHTIEGAKSRSWSFVWQAPKSGEDVTFTVMAMASNGDHSPFGDEISAQSYTVKAAKK